MKYCLRGNLVLKLVQDQSWLLSSFVLAIVLGWTQAVGAEGSRELTANGGNRPFLDSRSRDDPVANIPRRTTIQVYANPGETINLGSSANGIDRGVIRYTDPNGNTNICPIGVGQITTRAQEVAGPAPNGGGYNPCQVPVNVGGIWTIEFVGPDGATGNQDPVSAAANVLPLQNPGESFVSAWDVTVRSAAGVEIPGRAYATYIPLNLGDNQLALNSIAFVQTRRGDLFRVNLNGIDPFGFIFFSNNKGFTDVAGNPIYQSVPNTPLPNLHRPNQPDTAEDVTFKLFFNPPSLDLPIEAPVAMLDLRTNPPTVVGTTTTFLRQDPPPAPDISNFRFQFMGEEGTLGTADPTKGGAFVLDNITEPGNTQVVIDVNRNRIFGDGNDVILTSPIRIGRNTIPWDGRDNDGNLLPAGETPYESAIAFIIGDIHFPFLDPENNPLGLIIERVNARTLEVEDSLVYYNDSRVDDRPGGPNPISGLLGLDSTRGAHEFNRLFGNNKGIDTWTSLVAPAFVEGGIVIDKVELNIDKVASTNSLEAGSPVSFTLTARSLPNNQANPPLIPPDTFTSVEGIKVTDNVPDAIGNITWTCEITAGVGTCVTPQGTGNNVDVTLNLSPGAEVKITINGEISAVAAGGELVNTAIVSPPPDTFEPNPQTDPNDPLGNVATATLNIIPSSIQPTGIKSSRLVIDADNSGNLTTGDTVEYKIIYSNQDPDRDVTNFLVTDKIDTSKVTFIPGSYSFSTSDGATVTANPTFNGSTDINLTNPNVLGTLPSGGSQVTITYQVKIDAPLGTQISNQAIATSQGGTLETIVTDAFSGAEDLPQVVDDGVDTGNLPTTEDDDPTVLTVGGTVGRGEPKFVLVKRITNVIKNGFPISGINFGIPLDDPNDPNDNLPGWTQLSTRGPVGVFRFDQPLESGDLVEYTIYFLAEGTQINNVKLCDPIPEGTTFFSNSFGSNQGILLHQNGTEVTQTNVADTDRGRFFSPLAPLVTPPCPNQIEPQGAVFVELGDIPATAPGNVGFVRFRVRID